jgi:hypothetical protein
MDALLGYEGPFFPSTDDLNKAYDSARPNLVAARIIGEMIARKQGCRVECRTAMVTGDYEWFVGLVFIFSNREAVILLPQARDATRDDGLGLDRSIALYVKGYVVQEFQTLLEALKEQLSRPLSSRLRQA